MKITFITPAPFVKRIPLYRLGGKAYGQSNSITGPLILGGILKKAGHEVEVYEELNGSVNYKKLMRETDVFCLSVMTSNAERAYELADRFHKESSAKVIMGGIHVTALPEEALAHADQVITGEGERVILNAVEGRCSERIIRGIPYEDLDQVPFPDYSILKTKCQAANVISTRGCPFDCTFCSTTRMFSNYRKRSVDNVISEIRMYKELGFKYINFEDDNFTADKERAKEICRRMISEGLIFKEVFFFGRTDLARDEELLDLLSRAHLTRVLIGIESLNQEALDAVNKRQSISDIKAAALACRKHGIRLIASIVLGLDEDTRDDIRNSVSFASSVDAYQLQPAVLTPFPGTPVYDQLVSEDRMLKDQSWTSFDMMSVVFQPANMTPWELQEEFYRAARNFYSYKSAFRIGRLFGAEYGFRRFFLAFSSRLGAFGAHAAAGVANGNLYYNLKHAEWSNPFHRKTAETGSDKAGAGTGRTVSVRHRKRLADMSQRRVS